MKSIFYIFEISIFLLMSCSTEKNNKLYNKKDKKGVIYIENHPKQIYKKNDLTKIFHLNLQPTHDTLSYCDTPFDKIFDNHGNFYIINESSCTIKKFNKDGKFIHSFGKRGNGPGEFVSYGNKKKIILYK